MKRLLLLRHASAGDGPSDAERPLSERGRGEARRIAERLARIAPPPEVALCSTARRARETFEAVRAVLAPSPRLHLEDALYLASAAQIRERVAGLEAAVAAALVIGHNPGLEGAARELAPEGAPPALRALRGGLAPAALVVIDLDVADWEAVASVAGRLVSVEAP